MKKVVISVAAAAAVVWGGWVYFNQPAEETSAEPARANTVLDKGLYGMEYDDYNFEAIAAAADKKWNAAGCSEVRRGNFIGRNLDWYINREASAVIKVNAKQGDSFETSRFASIGVVGSMPEFTVDAAESGEYEAFYQMMPVPTVDGINENGVYMGINVTATGETSFDKSKWVSGAWGLGANNTNNPESQKNYCVALMIRYVLDHAKDYEDAKNLIKSVNWYEPNGFPHEGESQAFHWLLCDTNHSCVVEFVDGQIYFNEADDICKPSYGTIMTNFSNTMVNPTFVKEPIYQNHGCGYERYDLLVKNYDMATDAEGMKNLMSKVWYTNSYSKPLDSEDFFFSEYYCDEYPGGYLYTKGAEMWKEEGFRQKAAKGQADLANKALWHIDETPLWYTTHTSVYDIEKRELNVLIHEGKDGMTKWYKADLNTSFAKPLNIK